MKLTLIEKKDEAKGIKTFIFKPDTKLDWIAGQYLIYSLPHEKEDLRGRQRFFTISSAPFQKFPSITTRIEKKPSTFKKFLNGLKIGDKVNAKGPDGDFVLSRKSNLNILIAGGIGITPFIAMLRDIDFNKSKQKIKLFYASKTSEILFKKEIDEITKKNKNIEVEYYIGPKKIDKKFLNRFISLNTYFFVSGPDSMVSDFEDYLKREGVEDKNLKLDYFSGYNN
jgi:ferredoxin-NADP reductase